MYEASVPGAADMAPFATQVVGSYPTMTIKREAN